MGAVTSGPRKKDVVFTQSVVYSNSAMKNELIHTEIITLDITRDKAPAEPQRFIPSIEDSLNAVIGGLTLSLINASAEERKQIEKRIENILPLLDRRNW